MLRLRKVSSIVTFGALIKTAFALEITSYLVFQVARICELEASKVNISKCRFIRVITGSVHIIRTVIKCIFRMGKTVFIQ